MAENSKRRGLMLILSSPSGAGKTTLSRRLLEEDKETLLSISMTTRGPRPGEVNGEDYIFVTPEEFDRRIKNDEFLEYANVFGNFYGTLKKDVDKIAKNICVFRKFKTTRADVNFILSFGSGKNHPFKTPFRGRQRNIAFYLDDHPGAKTR